MLTFYVFRFISFMQQM